MPRHAALLADEMGLGKTAQVILALRLLFQAGLIRRALIVCPKPLVINWTRELQLWADGPALRGHRRRHATPRRATWLVSNCPLKLVNYELLTRDADVRRRRRRVRFDLVVLDEAQRIKNRESKTAQVVRVHRAATASWALTGTPIENQPGGPGQHLRLRRSRTASRRTRRPKLLPQLTARLHPPPRPRRRCSTDMPPKIDPRRRPRADAGPARGLRPGREGGRRPPQRAGRHDHRAARLRAGDAAQADLQLRPADRRRAPSWSSSSADMAEVAESGRKAIIFSQWVEPLEMLAAGAGAVRPAAVPRQGAARTSGQPILDHFKSDPTQARAS